MGFTFITFQGFDLISAVAGEVKEPGQIIPRAMYTSLAVALIIYIPFLFIIATAGIPAGQSITVLSRQNTETIVAVAVKNYLGTLGYWLIIVAAILSMLSALYANLLAAAHIAYTMSQDWTLPRFLGIVRKESGIPVRALYMSSIILILCLIFIHDLASAGAAASLVFLISFILVHITNSSPDGESSRLMKESVITLNRIYSLPLELSAAGRWPYSRAFLFLPPVK